MIFVIAKTLFTIDWQRDGFVVPLSFSVDCIFVNVPSSSSELLWVCDYHLIVIFFSLGIEFISFFALCGCLFAFGTFLDHIDLPIHSNANSWSRASHGGSTLLSFIFHNRAKSRSIQKGIQQGIQEKFGNGFQILKL